MSNKIHLGYRMLTPDEKQEVKDFKAKQQEKEEDGEEVEIQAPPFECGDEVHLRPTHLVVTGQTQEAGKTTTLEKLSEEAIKADKKVVVFLTKKGEGGFQREGTQVKPYFKDEVDWEYVVQILESAMKKSMSFEESWIINAVEAEKYDFLERAETLQDVSDNIKELLRRHRDKDEHKNFSLKGPTEGVFTRLDKYLEKVVPKIQQADLSTSLDLHEGVNVMDLRNMDEELQSLVIGKTIEKIREDHTDTIPIMPEAWKFLPQGTGSPCKRPVEKFIREAAGQGNFLWIDSQDITGVDKQILKQVNNWILGYQREKNEVDRTRDQMPLPKRKAPGKEQVMGLKIGEFFLCDKNGIKKVYVDPVWIDEVEVDGLSGKDLAKAVACESVSSEDIKWARKDQPEEEKPDTSVMTPDGDDTEYDTVEEAVRGRKEDKNQDTLEKKVNQLNERMESLKQQVDSYEDELEDKEEVIEEKEKTIKELEDQIENQEMELERLRNDVDQSESEKNDLAQTIKNHTNGSSEEEKEKFEGSGVDESRIEEFEDKLDSLEDRIDQIEEQAPDVDIDIPEKKIEQMIERKLEEQDVSGNAPENVLDDILGDFQEEAINALMEEVEEMSTNQKKLLLYLEAKGSRVGSKKEWIKNSLGWKNYGDRMSKQMDELAEKGYARKDGTKFYPKMKDKVEGQLDGYDADESVVEETYQKLMARIKEDSEEE